jgi:Mn-dependent DtxR family transcriptional regulator
MRRLKKTYYSCFIRDTEELVVSQTLQQIADTLGVHRNSVRKYLKNTYKYSCKDYIIWKGIEIKQIKRGFALK